MVDRDEVIEYLLHEMPEAERTAFAERWFNEPELYESVRMAESSLLDDYVRHKLSRTQRRRIEQYLLGSEAQRRKLAFAAALCAALPQAKRWSMPWAAIAAALLVAFTAGSAWLGIQNQRLRQEVARLQRSAPAASGGLFTAELPADTVRGTSAPNSVRVPAGASMLRLELELRPGDEQNVVHGGRVGRRPHRLERSAGRPRITWNRDTRTRLDSGRRSCCRRSRHRTRRLRKARCVLPFHTDPLTPADFRLTAIRWSVCPSGSASSRAQRMGA